MCVCGVEEGSKPEKTRTSWLSRELKVTFGVSTAQRLLPPSSHSAAHRQASRESNGEDSGEQIRKKRRARRTADHRLGGELDEVGVERLRHEREGARGTQVALDDLRTPQGGKKKLKNGNLRCDRLRLTWRRTQHSLVIKRLTVMHARNPTTQFDH